MIQVQFWTELFSHSVISNSAKPGTAARQASLSITSSRSLCKLMSIDQWLHPAISSSAIPFSYYLQFPASGSFQMSQFFTSGGQSIRVSASASVLPMNTQDWFPLGWTSWISLQSKGLSRIFSTTIVQQHPFFSAQLSLKSNSHSYMTTGKTIALTRWTFVDKVMFLLFNMLFRLVITFLPTSKRLLISWLKSSSAMILEPNKIKSDTASTVSPSIGLLASMLV